MFNGFSQEKKYNIYKENGLYGIKDSKNKIILKPSNKYDYLDYVDFEYRIASEKKVVHSDSLFLAKKNRKYGIIDLEGKEIIPVKYYWIQPTNSIVGNYFLLKDTTKKCGIVDIKGNIIIPVKYDRVSTEDYFAAKDFPYIKVIKNNKCGAFDFKGNEILPTDYGSITLEKVHLSNPKLKVQDYFYFKVKIGFGETFVDLNGNILYPPTEAPYLFLRESKESSTGLEIYEGTDILGNLGNGKYTVTELYTNKILESSNINDKRRELIESGDNYYKQEKYKKAIECYSEALITKGLFDSFLHFKLGICYYRTKKYDKAVTEFTICKETTPFQDMKDSAEKCIKASQDTKDIIANRNEQIVLGLFRFALGATDAYLRMQENTKTQKNSKITRTSNEDGTEDYSSNKTESQNSSKTECGLCNGKGSIVEYTSNYGISDRKYCEECGKTVDSTHYHKTCSRCGGKGYK